MKFPNIEAERARVGMTKEQLAKALQVSVKTLWNWEHRGVIPPGKMDLLEKLFGCSAEYLLADPNN